MCRMQGRVRKKSFPHAMNGTNANAPGSRIPYPHSGVGNQTHFFTAPAGMSGTCGHERHQCTITVLITKRAIRKAACACAGVLRTKKL